MEYSITGHTRMGCLLGTPVAHSLSPMMYNESFQQLGIDWVYLCFDTAGKDLGAMVQTLRDMNVYGFNLTMPDKEQVIPYLDELSPAAQMMGAVNTVKNENGRLIGYNTDGVGFMRSVELEGYDCKRAPMTLLGAGGAASAIAIQAALDGVPVLHIANRKGRSWNHALHLAEQINANTACRADVTDLADTETLRRHISESGLLANATSVGMAPRTDVTPLADTSGYHKDLLVSDVIYNPRETRFLAEAKAAGCHTCNGMYMLLYLGEAVFRLWTGEQMPVEYIRNKYFS